jgi:hypothetical protein
MADTGLSEAEPDEDLAAAEAWAPGLGLPKLTDADRDVVHQRIDELAAERETRGDAHRERLRKTARWLGREVAAHRVLLADAERRLDALALTLDPDSVVPILAVPYAEAVDITRAAFAAGFNQKAVA